jgi:hypothetical protein
MNQIEGHDKPLEETLDLNVVLNTSIDLIGPL